MHQDNFNKKGGNGWGKEVHGTKDQNVLVDDDNKHEIDTNEILCRLMQTLIASMETIRTASTL